MNDAPRSRNFDPRFTKKELWERACIIYPDRDEQTLKGQIIQIHAELSILLADYSAEIYEADRDIRANIINPKTYQSRLSMLIAFREKLKGINLSTVESDGLDANRFRFMEKMEEIDLYYRERISPKRNSKNSVTNQESKDFLKAFTPIPRPNLKRLKPLELDEDEVDFQILKLHVEFFKHLRIDHDKPWSEVIWILGNGLYALVIKKDSSGHLLRMDLVDINLELETLHKFKDRLSLDKKQSPPRKKWWQLLRR